MIHTDQTNPYRSPAIPASSMESSDARPTNDGSRWGDRRLLVVDKKRPKFLEICVMTGATDGLVPFPTNLRRGTWSYVTAPSFARRLTSWGQVLSVTERWLFWHKLFHSFRVMSSAILATIMVGCILTLMIFVGLAALRGSQPNWVVASSILIGFAGIVSACALYFVNVFVDRFGYSFLRIQRENQDYLWVRGAHWAYLLANAANHTEEES